MNTAKPTNLDEYAQQFAPEVAARLHAIHQVVKAVAPDVLEVMSYGMPAYRLPGQKGYPALFIGAHANHIGLYPGLSKPPQNLRAELATYQTGKGTVQFSHKQPLPMDFIEAYVTHRLHEARS